MDTPSPPTSQAGRARFRWLVMVNGTLWLLAIAFLLGACAVALAVIVTGFGIGHWPLQIPVTGQVAQPAADLPATVGLAGRSEIMIHDATFAQTALWACGQLATMGLALAVLVPLLRATGTNGAERPFSATNVDRLRRVGLILMFGSLAVAAIHTVTNWLIAESALGDVAGGPYPEIPWWQMFAAFAVLAVTELVRQGTAMREELDEIV